jgi:ABC-type phosphate transport system substrate-binding protein
MRLRLVLAVALAAGLASVPASAEDPAPQYRVIVNRANPVETLTRSQASGLFLKETTAWPGGATVKPVELAGDAPARRKFAEEVHGKSLAAVRSYWTKAIFSGREVPPIEKPTDDDVVAYVRANEGAIGVVSGAASTAGTKVVRIAD